MKNKNMGESRPERKKRNRSTGGNLWTPISRQESCENGTQNETTSTTIDGAFSPRSWRRHSASRDGRRNGDSFLFISPWHFLRVLHCFRVLFPISFTNRCRFSHRRRHFVGHETSCDPLDSLFKNVQSWFI